MSVRIKLKDWDIVVLPFEGKVLGRLRKDGTRKEIATHKNRQGYHKLTSKVYPSSYRSRIIWIAVNGPIPEGKEINHINHDVADDAITNLELVTRKQNTQYRRKTKRNMSGFKGVSYNKITKNYRSRIGVDGRDKDLGYYNTPEEAAKVYDEAARKYFGKFAVLNFPDTSHETEVP